MRKSWNFTNCLILNRYVVIRALLGPKNNFVQCGQRNVHLICPLYCEPSTSKTERFQKRVTVTPRQLGVWKRQSSKMTWLKLISSLKHNKVGVTKPFSEYLQTPLKNCIDSCPCRLSNITKKNLNGAVYNISNIKLGVFKQPQPNFYSYLHTLLADYHAHHIKKNYGNLKTRLQDLRVHRIGEEKPISKKN